MGNCPDAVKRLIDRYTQQSDQIRSPDYNETLIRIDFINPLMMELGWDIDNRQGFAEQYREVVHEDRVKVAGQTKAPDYSFRVGGARKFFLEAKKPAVDIKNNWEPAYQLRRYAWSAKLSVSLLTDFEELAVYDARIQPKQLEKASVARREFIRYTDYPDRWDFLSGTFSKDAVLKGEFDRYCESKKGRGAQLIDDAFLTEIEAWRKGIATSLARHNEALDEGALNFAVQRIIDRIIFLRIAEDRGTETVGQLQSLLNGDNVYARLVTLFNRADERYNSGLFHFHKEKDRDEDPDTLTPTLEVDDKTLKGIIKALYYPQSPYEFTMVSADILGSVYERFLGKVITLTAGHNAKIEEKPEVRKAGGVYYTPTYIVDYIVKNTVGKLLDDRGTGVSPVKSGHGRDGRATLRILDPACGSGSFLIGAYQFLLDWYLNQYAVANPTALATGKKPVLRPGLAGGWALTIAERKRILLDHIHGVDLDGQAVEVTKLNLLLKCLEGETSQTLGFEQRLFRERALPDLGKNIVCGNSLVGTDIIGSEAWNAMSEEERSRVNPLDYERAFPHVFKRKDGGFDAVIGNPPYVQIENIPAQDRGYLIEKFGEGGTLGKRYDLYQIFVMKGTSVLGANGRLGQILPNTFLMGHSYQLLRKRLMEQTAIYEIVDLPQGVFVGVTVDTVLLFAQRAAAKECHEIHINCLLSKSDKSRVRSSDWDKHFTLRQNALAEADGFQINVSADPALQAIAAKMMAKSQPLGAVAEGGQGIILYETARDAEAAKYTGSVHKDGWKRLLRGKNIARYQTLWDGEFVNYGRWLWRAREERFFNQPKILLHAMRNKSLKRRLVGTYDGENYYNAHNLANIIARPGAGLDLKYVLAVFNSAAANYWYKAHFQNVNINPADFQRMPVPVLDLNRVEDRQTHDRLVSLVDSMLSLHKRLAAEQLPRRREQIQREIDATDRQIDALVYQLYGLTDDEIAIVEAATR